MSLPSAIADFYRRYARFDGRSTRPQFWWAFLYLAATGSLLALLFGLLGPTRLHCRSPSSPSAASTARTR